MTIIIGDIRLLKAAKEDFISSGEVISKIMNEYFLSLRKICRVYQKVSRFL